MKERVVVTGIGALTPLGLDMESTWENGIAGKSGIAPITLFDASNEATRFAGEVKGFDPSNYIDLRECKRYDRFIHLGNAAGIQAIENSKLEESFDILDKNRIGIIIGSGIGGLTNIQETHLKSLKGGSRKISPFFIAGSIINMIGGILSIKYGLMGPNFSIATACATSSHTIGLAARLIAYGDADVIIAGGAEAPISHLGVGGFNACKALSTRNDNPTKASRPWDKERDGFVLSEGAVALTLESYSTAVKRGANILAELVGFGMSADAYHVTAPQENGNGAYSAMSNALKDAKIDISDISYINAHGTSTPLGDMIEISAIEKLYHDNPDSIKNVSISSTKSMTGHLLGAAGAIEAAYSIMALKYQIIPPTINLNNPDTDSKWDLTPNEAHKKELSFVMSNSFGFGGKNSTLIFKRYTA